MTKPLAYTLGNQPFCEISLQVDANVLIPRPETEQLVALVSQYIEDNSVKTIIDVGTGSGAIALALGNRHPSLRIIGTDVSEAALAVARHNATILDIRTIQFSKSNLLQPIDGSRLPPADIIAANLPYVPSGRIPALPPAIRDFEPHLALDGGVDGFGVYRRLFNQMRALPWLPKAVFCEIDDTHRQNFVVETRKRWPKARVQVQQDLAEFDRFGLIYF